MENGNEYTITVRFVRALAILSSEQIDNLKKEIEKKTQGKYSDELIMQAINMAPECTFDQTLSNLVNNAVRVFESILQAECRQILFEVKAIREQRIYPTCRIRYQIIGIQYREMVKRTFQTTLPNVYQHLQKREYFCDYLLQTGIFNNPDLDRQHHELYDRIL